MTKKTLDPGGLQKLLWRRKIATLEELKKALGTGSTMSLFRTLKRLGYCTSYSHRGKYYTLAEIPRFDRQGLWEHKSVWFSRYGNLGQTAKAFVEEAPAGMSAAELDGLLHVETKEALLKLYRQEEIDRESVAGVYVYLSQKASRRQGQLKKRRRLHLGAQSANVAGSEELKAAIVLFYSLLDEKQRRLYAGLEAGKLGGGGDREIARLLGLDEHTVARGRKELFEGKPESGRTRRPGGGRKSSKKNA